MRSEQEPVRKAGRRAEGVKSSAAGGVRSAERQSNVQSSKSNYFSYRYEGDGKISAECKVQGAEKKTVQGPKPAHRSLVRSFALSLRHSDTPLPRYQLFLSPVSPLSLLNQLLCFGIGRSALAKVDGM